MRFSSLFTIFSDLKPPPYASRNLGLLVLQISLLVIISLFPGDPEASIIEVTADWLLVNNGVFELEISTLTAEIRSAKLVGSDIELNAEFDAYSLFPPEFAILISPDTKDGPYGPHYNGTSFISIVCNTDEVAIIRLYYITGFMDIYWDFKFIYGLPYFIVTTAREIKESNIYVNAQQCVMYTTRMDDSYIVNYENMFIQTMSDGELINTQDAGSNTIQHSMFTAIDHGLATKFPAMAWHDRNNDITAGVIVTNVSPNQRKTISYHGGGKHQNNFCEGQWNLFGKADDESLYLKKGTLYGMEMYYYLDYGDVELFDSLNKLLFNCRHYDPVEDEYFYLDSRRMSFNDTRYWAASWGGRAQVSPSYLWTFPQASNDWICTAELFKHRAISIPSSQNGRRNCHIIDFFTKVANQDTIAEITSIDASDCKNYFTEEYGNHMIGAMEWELFKLSHTLHYEMYEDSDKLVVRGDIRTIDSIELSDIYVELEYTKRVTEVVRVDEYIWDIRCRDNVYDTIGITIYDCEGIERIEDTGESLRLYILHKQTESAYMPGDSWLYKFIIFPHTGYSVNKEEDITAFHDLPEEDFRKYYKTLVGYGKSDEAGVEPNWNILIYDVLLDPDESALAIIRMYTEKGAYPVKFYFFDKDIVEVEKNYVNLPESEWRYDKDTGVLKIESSWQGLTELVIRSEKATHSTYRKPAVGVNSPNPFNERTLINFWNPRYGIIKLYIYDMGGRLVRKLVEDYRVKGWNNVVWDGRNESGIKVTSGIYICRAYIESGSAGKKILLLK